MSAATAIIRMRGLSPASASTEPAGEESWTSVLPWITIGSCVGIIVFVLALCGLIKCWNQQQEKEARHDYAQVQSPSSCAVDFDISSNDPDDETGGTPRESFATWITPWLAHACIPMESILVIEETTSDLYTQDWSAVFENRAVTIKVLKESHQEPRYVREFLEEMRLASLLQHACVVGFLGVVWTARDGPWMVMESTTMDLRQVIRKYNRSGRQTGFDAQKLHIAFGIASALAYLHGRTPCVIHRDVSSYTTFLTENGDAKLGGFGMGRRHEEATITAGVGTARWMAPEILMGEQYDEKADVYSFGLLLSELDTHKMPYEDTHHTTEIALLQDVVTRRLKPRFTDADGTPIVRLAHGCLEFEPEMRLTAADVMHRLGQMR